MQEPIQPRMPRSGRRSARCPRAVHREAHLIVVDAVRRRTNRTNRLSRSALRWSGGVFRRFAPSAQYSMRPIRCGSSPARAAVFRGTARPAGSTTTSAARVAPGGWWFQGRVLPVDVAAAPAWQVTSRGQMLARSSRRRPPVPRCRVSATFGPAQRYRECSLSVFANMWAWTPDGPRRGDTPRGVEPLLQDETSRATRYTIGARARSVQGGALRLRRSRQRAPRVRDRATPAADARDRRAGDHRRRRSAAARPGPSANSSSTM